MKFGASVPASRADEFLTRLNAHFIRSLDAVDREYGAHHSNVVRALGRQTTQLRPEERPEPFARIKARLVGEFPAMLARLTNAEGKFITLHRTYLTADGSKAPVHSAKKLAAGAVENGVIRLYPAGGVVCLAEGIETALSVHALTGLPAWSVVSLSGMKRFGPETIPDGVRTIRICGDNDRSYAGAAGAYELASRLRRSRPELEVSVHIPQAAGTDWNDVLLAHGMLKL